MATYATAGMYPPIVDSYIPAFLKSDVVRSGSKITLYFQISSFTNSEDVKEIHVSFTRQDNYKSIFYSDPYALGIWISDTWSAADNLITEGKHKGYYKIDIPIAAYDATDTGQITYGTYYKIQIRFSKINIASERTSANVSDYLLNTDNMNYFSEWSTVLLGRFISDPHISLKINGDDNELTNQTRDITTSMASLHGKFSTVEKDENLQSYQIKLNSSDNSETYFSSPIIQTNKNNGINDILYTIPYSLETNVVYNIIFTYTTRNLYTETLTFPVRNTLNKRSWGETEVGVDSVTNAVIGKLNISLSNLLANDIITIRRADNLDGYTKWDIVYVKTFAENTENFSYDDYTIEAGTMYKYEINLQRNSLTYATTIENVLTIFDDAFLTGEGTQLCVKFNPNISGYRRNVNDSIVTTIGSKYPYITRNNSVDYRSFSLSGTIAYEMDNEHRFTTRSSIYKDEIEIYGSYFVNHYVNQRNDRLTQRKFREMVLNYLYSDKPKLFRSTPEGNILVRITDVSLTPNAALGRMIYDFSCTVTEIGEANIDNAKLYEIQDFGEA